MRKLLLAALLVLPFLASCGTEYYEPKFGIDNLPATVPAKGGSFYVDFDVQLYETKFEPARRFFDFEYRVVICETVFTQDIVTACDAENFLVTIPENKDDYPKPIVVEASIHYVLDGNEGNWWGDWFPVASAVQLCY